MLRSLIVLALVLSTPALAQSYHRSDIVRGLCQPNGCDEFTVLRADRIAASDEGTLLKTRVRTFHASSAGRQERGEQDGYVYLLAHQAGAHRRAGGTHDGLLSCPLRHSREP